ncbi:MAG TPA: hypothetical protein VEA38_15055 [Terriglobales bacterium]|nr:hypothetical protein [Terriglobales bacterium]
MSDEPRVTRAREDSDAGVRRCVELMTTGQWVSGTSHEAVAEEFGVSPRTVESWATSASRVIRIALEGDKEAIRARMVATLETVTSLALGAKTPDLKAAVSAIDSQAKLLGLAKSEIQLSGSVRMGSREEQLAVAKSVVAALESAEEE